ncbi:MAG: 4-hydroxybenzoyl-CoA thioesterase family active site protein [Myxococcaceae bacterium]|nr:4-hydroxybenzoyl-CoA thioesterase family active site protein [Myxococcaceae bacterium]
MITHDRSVRFEDVDAAGIVFFARFFGYCHDAMERFFDDVPGGYAALTMKRKVGFPSVHASADFKAPIGYGDIARIEATITKLGTTSCHFRFEMTRARDGAHVATMSHVHVCTDLVTMTKLPFPADVRAALAKHVVAAVAG